jgi:hypothetical protein
VRYRWTKGAALGLGLISTLVVACGEGQSAPVAPGAVKEYIVGSKRLAGPYGMQTEASRGAGDSLGPADVVVEIKAAIAGWDPDRFTVKKDDVVELKLIGTDNGQLPALTGVKEFSGHGFHIYAYDIWANGLRAGVERSVKFKASEAGTFPFECVVFCSTDHYKMVGKMTVTD